MQNTLITLKENLNTYYLSNDNISYSFNLPKLQSSSLYLYIDSNNSELTINLEEASTLKLILITSSLTNIKQTFNLSQDASLNLFTSDITSSDSNIIKTVNLNGLNASLKSYEFSSIKDIKSNELFITNHNFKSTNADSIFQILTKGTSIKDIDVVANIEKGMTDSNSSELIKGMMMSRKSKINAKPVLMVKHDDVKANHGCAIGTVDQNEIYYLMSRGLTYEDALEIISRSFINPILKEIEDEKFKETITPLLEGLINE